MTLSGRRRRDLAELERDLSADPAIQALADLFPVPPEPERTPATGRAPRRRRRDLVPYLVAVAVALGGLVCCVVAAPADEPILTVAGAVLALGAVTFLVAVPRHGAEIRDARLPEDAGRR